jgi:hypothetical protein
MRNFTVITVAISFLLVTACGRVANNPFAKAMTQDEAIKVLVNLPPEPQDSSSDSVSAQGLEDAIQQALLSGQVSVPRAARGAILSNGKLDATTLNSVVAMIAQGKNAFQVAKGVVNSAGGSSTKAKFNLDAIIAILQAALPMISTIAPQYAGIIQAIIVIIPTIQGFLSLFKKPAPAPGGTAALFPPMNETVRMVRSLVPALQLRA